MLGTNDVNLNYEVEQAPARLDFLIGRILELRPKVKVLVASVPPIDDARNAFRTGNDFMANSRVEAFNAAIPSLVAARQASGQNVQFVDINRALSIADIDDGLHPTRAGFDKIGDAFYRAITGVPEPGAAVLVLVASGCVGCLARRRVAIIRSCRP
jgi:lysophospholipase L1-like esterase